MKSCVLLICVTAQILVVRSKVLPDYLPQPCSKSHPNYKKCTFTNVNKLGPYLLKGIPELNIPNLNPMLVPLFVANRALDDCANFSFTLRNAAISGLNTTSIRGFTYNPETMRGELELHIEYMKVKSEYDIAGRISNLGAMNTGYLEANSNDIGLFFNYSLKIVEREGVKYYTLDDFERENRVGDARLNMTSSIPDFQLEVNMLTKFFNEDVQRSLLIGNLLFRPSVIAFYREYIERVLSTIPADELTPP